VYAERQARLRRNLIKEFKSHWTYVSRVDMHDEVCGLDNTMPVCAHLMSVLDWTMKPAGQVDFPPNYIFNPSYVILNPTPRHWCSRSTEKNAILCA
jgi:hypothetical protein